MKNTNGFEYVDLGLPSGRLWATCNVGANKPEEFGHYFMWASTTPNDKDNCDWANTPYCTNPSSPYDASSWSKYNSEDGLSVLELEDDVANVNMGGDWRIPSKEDIQELLDNTTSEWANVNDVGGRKFISKVDETKSIFIPAAGHCGGEYIHNVGVYGHVWSQTVGKCACTSWGFDFDWRGRNLNCNSRSNGFPIRGVK